MLDFVRGPQTLKSVANSIIDIYMQTSLINFISRLSQTNTNNKLQCGSSHSSLIKLCV